MHFELILVQGDRHGSSFSFLQPDNQFSQQHLLKPLANLIKMRREKTQNSKIRNEKGEITTNPRKSRESSDYFENLYYNK
jgi:hypothetical protein